MTTTSAKASSRSPDIISSASIGSNEVAFALLITQDNELISPHRVDLMRAKKMIVFNDRSMYIVERHICSGSKIQCSQREINGRSWRSFLHSCILPVDGQCLVGASCIPSS